LVNALKNRQLPESSQRLIWILAQIGGDDSRAPLQEALRGDHPDAVATAARGLAVCGDRSSGGKLAALLAHEAPAVQLAAAEALGRCGTVDHMPAVWSALRKKPDRFVDHALTLAVYRLANEQSLAQALDDDHPSVRRAAILVLEQRFPKRLTPSDVFVALRHENEELSAAARWVLLRHAEWGDEALRTLRESFENSERALDRQRQVRQLVHAFEPHNGLQAWVAESIGDKSIAPKQRAMLLSVVAESPRAALPKPWIEAVGQALVDQEPAVRTAAVRAAAVRQLAELDGKLAEVVDDDVAEEELRFEALRATVFRHPHISSKSFELLLARLATDRTPIERLAAAEVLARCRLSDGALTRVIDQVRGDPLISPSSLGPLLDTASAERRNVVADYLIEAVEHGWHPNKGESTKIVEALAGAEAGKLARLQSMLYSQKEIIRAQLREFEPLLDGGDVKLGRQVFFGKKVACGSCHAVGSEGGTVGPDLSKIGAIRAPVDLLEAIVSPSASIAQGFDTYVFTLSDGRTVTGVLASETSEVVVLRDSAGNELRLARHAIQDVQRIPASTMPDGLAKSLSRAELHGLLAFLRSLK
jgi:putative heme-binding domain-containing protein